jgi:RNA polymerase sigma factor (sigma-70 family)
MTAESDSSSTKDVDSLFARARSGDNTAWEELFRRCYPKVIRVVRRKLNSPTMRTLYDSTDFVSDVMKSLAANADRLEFPSLGSLIKFLERVAEQKVIDEYRRVHTQKRDIERQRHLGAGDGDSDGVGAAVAVALESAYPTPSQLVQASEAREQLLAGQSGPEREMIELKHQGYSNAEIARRTGWNIRKVQRFFQSLEESYHKSIGA